jgi:hypothetical protein
MIRGGAYRDDRELLRDKSAKDLPITVSKDEEKPARKTAN